MNNFSEGNIIIFIATDLLFGRGILSSSNGKWKRHWTCVHSKWGTKIH